MRYIALFIVSLFIFAPNQAQACRGPMLHTSVFLQSLPVAALDKSFVAVVESLEDSKAGFQAGGDDEIKVKIVKIINGSYYADTMLITVPLHSCYNGHDLKTGDRVFLAGKITDGKFEGEWKEMDLGQ